MHYTDYYTDYYTLTALCTPLTDLHYSPVPKNRASSHLNGKTRFLLWGIYLITLLLLVDLHLPSIHPSHHPIILNWKTSSHHLKQVHNRSPVPQPETEP